MHLSVHYQSSDFSIKFNYKAQWDGFCVYHLYIFTTSFQLLANMYSSTNISVIMDLITQ